jgi:hypothetical protein
LLGGAQRAHGAIEALIRISPTHPPGAGAESITYPGATVVNVTLQGVDTRRTYDVRALLLDANEKVAAESRRRVASAPDAKTWFEFYPAAASAPGPWRLVIEVDGERLAERSLVARRVPGPTASRALVTASISRNREPRRPLDVLGIPSAAYFYVELNGLVHGRAYKVRHAVVDGAGKIVDEHARHTQGWGPREVFWVPVAARATDAAGTWTLRVDVDDQPVAQATIPAERGASKSKAASLERWWVAVAAAMALMIAYVGYHLATLPATAPWTAPPRRASVFDPSLVALVFANLLPLAAVLFAGSDPVHVLFVYFCETFIIAGFAVLRIFTSRDHSGSRVVALAIFLLVFGLATVSWALGMFYFLADRSDLLELQPEKRRGLEAIAHPAFDLWSNIPLSVDIVYLLAALFLSNCLSFVRDYLKTGTYLTTTHTAEVLRPANRLALLFVGFWAMNAATHSSRGSPLVMLAVLVALKLFADTHAYLNARGLRPPIDGPS